MEKCLQNPCFLPTLPIKMSQKGFCNNNQPANSSCFYGCCSGYSQIGPPLNVTCTAGNFSTPLGYCSPNPCYQPTITPSSAKTVGDCPALTTSGSSCTLLLALTVSHLFGNMQKSYAMLDRSHPPIVVTVLMFTLRQHLLQPIHLSLQVLEHNSILCCHWEIFHLM